MNQELNASVATFSGRPASYQPTQIARTQLTSARAIPTTTAEVTTILQSTWSIPLQASP